jgi:hypothetical protein
VEWRGGGESEVFETIEFSAKEIRFLVNRDINNLNEIHNYGVKLHRGFKVYASHLIFRLLYVKEVADGQNL